MENRVTIVVYHYVRDLKHSRYPAIKGLDIGLFNEQLMFIKRHYTIITMEQLIDAVDNDTELPSKAALLTFDDAYRDHYAYVFPILLDQNVQGSFFPPARAIQEHIVLDVNKIHHVLASAPSPQDIVEEIYQILDRCRDEYGCESNEAYYTKFAVADRFDTADVIFIKRLLQRGLEEQLRGVVTNALFAKFVGVPESTFARELYMNVDQIKEMKEFGMHIGSHGFGHYWLDSLSMEQQELEITRSLDFLRGIEGGVDSWTMAYPYGGYNSDTIDLLKKHRRKLALTIELGVASVSKETRFRLARLDTNDLPMDRRAHVNRWYELG